MLKRVSKIHKKRMLALALAFATVFASFPAAFAQEEDENYAEAVFGASTKYFNMHEDYANYMTPVERDGRAGLRSSGNQGCNMWLGITDSFMYDLPNDTPVDITVEYYDEGSGHFMIRYDSHDLADATVTAGTYKTSDPVRLTNTKEWKSHTFHIEDLKAANRIYNGDLLLSTWSPDNGLTKEEVIFGSMKITYGKYISPLKYTAGLGDVGNLMGENDATTLTIEAYNKDDKMPISVKITGAVFDEYGRTLENIPENTYEIGAHEDKTLQIPFANPQKHGLYTIEGKFETDYKSAGETVTEDFLVKFSVSDIAEEGDGNYNYGQCHQIMAYNMGAPEDVADVYVKVGARHLRDDIKPAVCRFNSETGNWEITEKAYNGWKYLKDRGIETTGILFGGDSSKDGKLPITEEDYQYWDKWVRDIVTQLDGLISIYEVWNEPNITSFNKNGATPAQYGELVKRTYKIIKDINPEIKVVSMVTAGVDLEWIEGALAVGAGDYCDAISVHPYGWTGMFRDKAWVDQAKECKALMEKYGAGDVELWASEIGFSSYTGSRGYTREEQSQNHILARALAKAYNLYDIYYAYCLADRARRDEYEENWGIIEWYDAKTNPYVAKESFLSMATYNRFIRDDSELKGLYDENSEYAFWFDNKKLGKDVMLLRSNNGTANAGNGVMHNYMLGCPSVEVYDVYGNKIDTLYSDNGEYCISFDANAVYVVGNFTAFEVKDANPTIKPSSVKLSGAGGDVVTLTFTKNINKNLKINVENTVEVVENNGFKGNTAEVKIRVPNDIGQTYRYNITISDNTGKTYYAAQHTLSITSPVSISAFSEPASDLNNNQWRVRATVTNLCNTQEVKGIYKVESPSNVAQVNTEREFDLAPGEEITYYLNIPEKVNKNVIELVTSATLTTGQREENTAKLNFTSCVYAEKAPTIDGVIDEHEWLGSWVGSDRAEDVKEIPTWGGPEDLSFSGSLMWDDENLYFLGIATDDVHSATYQWEPDNPFYMWSTDSFQFAVDDRASINPVEAGYINEFGMGTLPNGEGGIYRFSSYSNPNATIGIVENCDIVIKRYDTYTVYEVRLPWSEIFYEGYKVDWEEKEHKYRFSVLLNDNDDDGNGRGWIEYMAGIGDPKTVDGFGDMQIKK